MASLKLLLTLPFLLLMVLATTQAAQCYTLRAKISCLDCRSNYDFSGNKIVVKCEKVKNLAVAITRTDGSFETTLPSDASNSQSPPSNCIAKLVGGPHQLYASRKDMASIVIKATNSKFFTIATALKFSTCKQHNKCQAMKDQFIADSKTVDLPLPREWGLAPSSYYLPELPIIGIP
ncbi:uncharacterized protein LOC111012639 [Momordica charantia]|uniref:Uncharacterized protein LOC111012639 n=1 Tax=Momordica charantia TaxID=3673 RepID=A0A6J1CMJ0_MOMCH|nr:uncharacterized protein LOC111012639 [Momordica charantia]